jgi:hypothetical protein
MINRRCLSSCGYRCSFTCEKEDKGKDKSISGKQRKWIVDLRLDEVPGKCCALEEDSRQG